MSIINDKIKRITIHYYETSKESTFTSSVSVGENSDESDSDNDHDNDKDKDTDNDNGNGNGGSKLTNSLGQTKLSLQMQILIPT